MKHPQVHFIQYIIEHLKQLMLRFANYLENKKYFPLKMLFKFKSSAHLSKNIIS